MRVEEMNPSLIFQIHAGVHASRRDESITYILNTRRCSMFMRVEEMDPSLIFQIHAGVHASRRDESITYISNTRRCSCE